jgi:hypothetical protein
MTGSINIHPQLAHRRPCPVCRSLLAAEDWCIPGMWTLARYSCPECRRSWWVDLPFNLGVISPCYLEPDANDAARPGGPAWYRDVTLAAWKSRLARPVRLEKKVFRTVRRICLVNALGNCWGDALATVAKLNALGDLGETGIVVLTTPNLAPHLPEFIAEAWLVDGYNHADAATWNPALADQVKSEVQRFERCVIPAIFQLPTVTPSEVRSLSGVTPFDRTRWDERLAEAPTVTFMWRDDRCWAPELPTGHWSHSGLAYRRGIGRLIRYWKTWRSKLAPGIQARRLNQFGRLLQQALPSVDLAVCGVGRLGRLDPWIKDLRTESAGEAQNRLWCERAARSHLLIGVLGSHMVLPGGHSGGMIDLVPNDFLRNVLTDQLVTTPDKREALFLYRNLPLSTSPVALAEIVVSMLVNYTVAHVSFHGDYYRPLSEGVRDHLSSLNDTRMASTQQLSPRFRSLQGP